METNIPNRTEPRDIFTPERIARAMLAFLWLGLAARAVRYGLRFPLWEDECFLCVNFIDRSFAELLQPLTYHQVAPPLFLWLERAAVLLLGYSEWSLRLIPFLASLASLFLFRRLARNFLDGPGQLLAFGIFAVAYPGIRYAAEAKQYATDLFAALLLLTMAAEWYRTRRPAWLATLALIAAPILWLSYPAAFVAGGVSLAIGATLILPLARQYFSKQAANDINPPRPIAIGGWIVFNIAILIGFGSLMLIIRRQSGAELGFMTDYWREAFPPLSNPLQLIIWFFTVHTSELLAWPIGGARGASAFTAILFVIGLWQLLKTRNLFWSLLILGPLGLNFIAAMLERYPYGGHMKFSMYFGPAVCLLAGCGAATWNARTARNRPRLARRAAIGTAAALALIACASITRDVLHPYKTQSDERARAFAQWFWFNAEAEAAVTVVDRHAGKLFSPAAHSELTWTAMFLCNRAIYAPKAPPEMPATKERLRCLVYRDPRFEFREQARDAWLAEMRVRHELVARVTFPFTRYGKNEEDFVTVDYLDLYTFQPRETEMARGETTTRQ